MAEFQEDWTHVATMSSHKQLSVSFDVLLSNYSDIFRAELGTIVDFKVKLLVKPRTIPKVCKVRSVSFAINGAIERKLDRLKLWNHGEGDLQ